MATLWRHFLVMALGVALVACQLPFSVLPEVSDELKDKTIKEGGAGRFINLWEYALKTDGQGSAPAIRINFEAKTILAPGPNAMVNLVPQDTSDPLYGASEEAKALRRKFLMDHLLLEVVEPSDPQLSQGEGLRVLTFSGKDIFIRRDARDNLFVDDVPVESVRSLRDGTQIYVLEETLFDNQELIKSEFQRSAFRGELSKPLGPPLILPKVKLSGSVVGPPAPPPTAGVRFSRLRGGVSPPAPPPSSRDAIIFPSEK